MKGNNEKLLTIPSLIALRTKVFSQFETINSFMLNTERHQHEVSLTVDSRETHACQTKQYF